MALTWSSARLALIVGVCGISTVTALHLRAASSNAAPMQQSSMAVVATDYAFSAPDTVEAGFVTLDFSNAGTETHHVAIERLPDTLDADAFNAALQGDERAALEMVQSAGGAAAIDPGLNGEVVVNLQAGAYALICVIPSPRDRVPHVLKGMIKPLIVTPSAVTGSPPASNGEITLRDFQIEMPS